MNKLQGLGVGSVILLAGIHLAVWGLLEAWGGMFGVPTCGAIACDTPLTGITKIQMVFADGIDIGDAWAVGTSVLGVLGGLVWVDYEALNRAPGHLSLLAWSLKFIGTLMLVTMILSIIDFAVGGRLAGSIGLGR